MGGNVSPLGEQETWMQAVSLLYPRVNHITPLSTAVWLNELVRLWWGQRRAPWVWCVLLTDVVTMDDMTCLLWDSWTLQPGPRIQLCPPVDWHLPQDLVLPTSRQARALESSEP